MFINKALLLAVFLNTSLLLAMEEVEQVILEEEKSSSGCIAISADELISDNASKRVAPLKDESELDVLHDDLLKLVDRNVMLKERKKSSELISDNASKRVAPLRGKRIVVLKEEEICFKVVDPDETPSYIPSRLEYLLTKLKDIETKEDVFDDIFSTFGIHEADYERAIPSLDFLLYKVNNRKDKLVVAEYFFNTLWQENLSSQKMQVIISPAYGTYFRMKNPITRMWYICTFLNAPAREKFIDCEKALGYLRFPIGYATNPHSLNKRPLPYPDDPIFLSQLIDFLGFTDSLKCLEPKDQRDTFKVFYNFEGRDKDHYLGFFRALYRETPDKKDRSAIIAAFLRAIDVDGKALRENIQRIKWMQKYVPLIALWPRLIKNFSMIQEDDFDTFDSNIEEIKDGIRIRDVEIKKPSGLMQFPGVKDNHNLAILAFSLSNTPSSTWEHYFKALAFFAPRMTDGNDAALALADMLVAIRPSHVCNFARRVGYLINEYTTYLTMTGSSSAEAKRFTCLLMRLETDEIMDSFYTLFSKSKIKYIGNRIELLENFINGQWEDFHVHIKTFEKKIPIFDSISCKTTISTLKKYKNLPFPGCVSKIQVAA